MFDIGFKSFFASYANAECQSYFNLMIEPINNSEPYSYRVEHPNPIAAGSEISIEQIRQELTWKLRRDVLYPGETIDNVQLDEDDDAIHFGAFKDDQLVGVVSLFRRGTDFQFRKLAVGHPSQKVGVGTALLVYITEYARENGGLTIWCNARSPAIGFYLKNGFQLSGKSFSKNNINYMIMDKAIVADI